MVVHVNVVETELSIGGPMNSGVSQYPIDRCYLLSRPRHVQRTSQLQLIHDHLRNGLEQLLGSE